MSGAPIASSALNAPQRSRSPRQQPPPSPQPTVNVPVPQGQVTPQALSAQVWADVARQPGASDLVKQMALEAQGGFGTA